MAPENHKGDRSMAGVKVGKVLNSCVEGRTGEWSCSTEEGRKGFEDMHELLVRIAKQYNIPITGAKKFPNL
jgi:hypothetical protein